MTRQYGLVGFPLTHSFSKKYFTEKFAQEGMTSCVYELFETEDAATLPSLFTRHPNLVGLNVTIPHKKAVMPLLQRLHPSAKMVGAVNVIKKEVDGTLTGYNSDFVGFKRSLQAWIGHGATSIQALVLGTGGAAAAVSAVLDDLKIRHLLVSRMKNEGLITYDDLTATVLEAHRLIVNTTPLGTFPKSDACPLLPYQLLTPAHFLYDLVYNPPETLFMKKGMEKGAQAKNGYEMLVLQAERAWEIWNDI